MVGIKTGIYKCQHKRNFDFSVQNILLGSLVWENMKQFNEVTAIQWGYSAVLVYWRKKKVLILSTIPLNIFFTAEVAGIVTVE